MKTIISALFLGFGVWMTVVSLSEAMAQVIAEDDFFEEIDLSTRSYDHSTPAAPTQPHSNPFPGIQADACQQMVTGAATPQDVCSVIQQIRGWTKVFPPSEAPPSKAEQIQAVKHFFVGRALDLTQVMRPPILEEVDQHRLSRALRYHLANAFAEQLKVRLAYWNPESGQTFYLVGLDEDAMQSALQQTLDRTKQQHSALFQQAFGSLEASQWNPLIQFLKRYVQESL